MALKIIPAYSTTPKGLTARKRAKIYRLAAREHLEAGYGACDAIRRASPDNSVFRSDLHLEDEFERAIGNGKAKYAYWLGPLDNTAIRVEALNALADYLDGTPAKRAAAEKTIISLRGRVTKYNNKPNWR